MTRNEDAAKVGASGQSEVVSISREEYERLTAAADGGGANPAPAVEEGPHLEDPEVRAAKREQLKAAGTRVGDDGLSDDMRAILREKG